MTTIMTQTNSEGSRHCDAKCHNAVNPKCTCVCGGRYHGAGRNGTLETLIKERRDELLKELGGLEAFKGQMSLFEEVHGKNSQKQTPGSPLAQGNDGEPEGETQGGEE